jgi:DNA-binding PadR family transcriptional regulator
MVPALTTTSYAILGLLAVKPWTTYELAQQMERALGQFWPRAESKIYEEPKKLAAHGFARASSETTGKRPRTVYSITAKGRRALADWVPTSGAGPALEFEQLVKVFFAEHGTKADLLATLAAAREGSVQRLGASARVPEAYLNGTGPFPERLPWLLLVGQFLMDFYLMVERWAEWSTAIVETWPDDLTTAQPDREVLEAQAAITRAHAHPERRDDGSRPPVSDALPSSRGDR